MTRTALSPFPIPPPPLAALALLLLAQGCTQTGSANNALRSCTAPGAADACVLAVDLTACCACPTMVSSSALSDTLVEYEPGRDYTDDLLDPSCRDVACSPCPEIEGVPACGETGLCELVEAHTDDPDECSTADECLLAIDLSACCRCPFASNYGELSETVVAYDPSMRYEPAPGCSDVACSPCPTVWGPAICAPDTRTCELESRPPGTDE